MVNNINNYLGYGRVGVFVDLMHVHNTSGMVDSGHYPPVFVSLCQLVQTLVG